MKTWLEGLSKAIAQTMIGFGVIALFICLLMGFYGCMVIGEWAVHQVAGWLK